MQSLSAGVRRAPCVTPALGRASGYHFAYACRIVPLPALTRQHIVFASKAAALGFALALVYVLASERWGAPGHAARERVEIVHTSRAPAARPAEGRGPYSYADAVALAAPAVVNIYTATRTARSAPIDSPLFEQLFGNNSGLDTPRNIRTGAGSGVIISAGGHIVTNHHLIDGTDEIEVMLASGERYRAQVIGGDPDSDLAVLEIDADGLPAITLADDTSLAVGDVVLAIGNPLGAGQTVTMGIVSATGRTSVGLNTFEDFIQTDAAINPGNSGGALINPHGELVGVNAAIFTQRDGAASGLGLAIPVGQVQAVAEQLIRHGRVIRGWLGVMARDLTPALRRELQLPERGVVVTGVVDGGPAQRAGIRAGDVLTRVAGREIVSARTLLEVTTMIEPGRNVTVEGVREGKAFEISAELVQRPLPRPPG